VIPDVDADRSAAPDVLRRLVGSLGSVGLAAATAVVIARRLGASDKGVLSTLSYLATVGAGIAAFGAIVAGLANWLVPEAPGGALVGRSDDGQPQTPAATGS
jgi:hypothetical protein